MTWKRFHYWSFVRRIHRSPVDSLDKNGPVMPSFCVYFVFRLNKLFKKAIEVPVISDAMLLIWRHSKGIATPLTYAWIVVSGEFGLAYLFTGRAHYLEQRSILNYHENYLLISHPLMWSLMQLTLSTRATSWPNSSIDWPVRVTQSCLVTDICVVAFSSLFQELGPVLLHRHDAFAFTNLSAFKWKLGSRWL